ncbi:hypothetical protein BDR26DRAFT_920355 [Obelidium mucronatum]|nr:hypothetical protein BDR26DRAFT_920355 [Obelidium mucronatum]
MGTTKNHKLKYGATLPSLLSSFTSSATKTYCILVLGSDWPLDCLKHVWIKEPSHNDISQTTNKTSINTQSLYKRIDPRNSFQKGESKYNNFAIALKSGSETFPVRTKAQFDTFLNRVANVLVIGEANRNNSEIGRRMVDVYHGALEDAKKRLGPRKVQLAEARKGKLVLDTSGEMGAGNGGKSTDGKSGNDTVQAGWFSNEGWRVDAHKNLPGFALLYNTFPDADWFMMIDDDSYLFLDGLHQFTKRYNPNRNYYFGQANKFRGCDDVTEMGDGPPIAQGGTGILLSRGAIKTMMEIVDQCIVQYEDCWAGDVRVGLCLRDVKIKLKHIPGFNGWPPQENFVFSPNPCETPLTYHHVLPAQMYKLRQIEESATTSKTRLTSSHMYHTFLNPIKNYTTMESPSAKTSAKTFMIRDENVERKGKPWMNFRIDTWEQCEARCIYYGPCVAWFHDLNKRCWLKKTPGGKDEMKGAWSGVMPNRYVCPPTWL